MSDETTELHKLAERIYRQVRPRVRESQMNLGNFTEKETHQQKRHTQNWPLYERACNREKLMFLRILRNAIDFLDVKYLYKGNGRPPMFYADLLKAMCIKAYHGYSSWRMESELRIARAMGVLGEVPKRSTLNKYMQDEKITVMLHDLLRIIAEPLALVETQFAADATGISKKYGNTAWQKVRHTTAEPVRRKEYVKLHILSGVKTNVVCSAEITKGTVHESPLLHGLLDKAAQSFRLAEVMADAGYLGRKNVKAIRKHGAKPWIKPKKNTAYNRRGRLSSWTGMLYIWEEHRDLFAQHYNLRQNVEATFSAIKRKFGDFCRCKKESSQENEILAKLVCFNACILAENLLLYDLEESPLIATL